MPSISNPRSQARTGSFNVTIFDINNEALYYYNTSTNLTVQMTSVSEPRTISYQRTSSKNGVKFTMMWDITTNSFLQDGDKFSFGLPEPLRFTDKTNCLGTDFWIKGDLDCTFSTNYSIATMTVKVADISNNGRLLADSFLQSPREL